MAVASGRPYNPVVTLNGWTLPWRMNDGVKEFHLVAEPVVRVLAPGMKAKRVRTTIHLGAVINRTAISIFVARIGFVLFNLVAIAQCIAIGICF